MFCWGNTTHQELCVEDSDTKGIILKPTLSKWSESNKVKLVAAGEFHVLYLTEHGLLYSCGSNQASQLGRTTKKGTNGETPGVVETFKDCTITMIACGLKHSMALDEWGQTFSWGCDAYGQLGTNLNVVVQEKPKIIKTLGSKHVIQIACGGNHCIVLTNDGELYSWGANNFGQCGLGRQSEKETVPQLIQSLLGVPISMIACGTNHTFVVSKSGAVFGWGKNSSGQLGMQDTDDKLYPAHLKTLRNVKVCHVECGEDFTAFLTLDGGVFTCGSGTLGQTGHGSYKDESVPRKVMELMGSTVTQIACGSQHLLCLVEKQVRACGNGVRGQLGIPHKPSLLVPTPVSFDDSEGIPMSDEFDGPIRVFAGGNHSFLLLNCDNTDFRRPDHIKQILTLEASKLDICRQYRDNDVVDQDLMAYLETVFGSLACVNGSFLVSDNEHYGCGVKVPGVDVSKAEKGFQIISRIENTSIKEIIFSNLTKNVIKKMKVSPPDVEALRMFIVLPLYHEMRNVKRYTDLQGPFAEAYNDLARTPKRIVDLWWTAQTSEYFEMLVDIFKSVIVYELSQPEVRTNKKMVFTRNIVQILNALSSLNKLNFENHKVPLEFFYIENLCDYIDLSKDYIDWLADRDSRYPHMCNYAFLFDVQCKALLLTTDQQHQMILAIRKAQLSLDALFSPAIQVQYLCLEVSRDQIVRDTIVQIAQKLKEDEMSLKKPLKVKFNKEDADDVGGVKKEFFLLLVKELFDPNYGMFKHTSGTHIIWFSNNPFEHKSMYNLIGTIYGLAIYNSVIIYVPFPLALYKKILQEPVTLEDLFDIDPSLASNLKYLLEYTGEDVEEVFSLCFAVNTEQFGQVQEHPLKENGENIAVTHENKCEYVELYVDFILNKSVEEQFKEFNDGFQKVCGGRIIKLFRSHELMSVVMGNEQYDWEEFESNCECKNGYSSNDPQIRWFWEVFHELSLEDKKKFLLFLTGSDRVPISGMRDIKIVIQPVADDRYYPVAHTCFNLLDLPRYRTKERLKYYLLQAIQQTQGFSLV